MRATRLVCASILASGALMGPGVAPASAQTPDTQAIRQEIDQLRQDFEKLTQQYGDRLAALEARLPAGPSGQAQAPASPPQAVPPPPAPVPPGADGAGGPGGALPVYGAAGAGSKVFNPDMAVIGNFLGAAGSNKVNPGPAMQMQESEVSFQAVVDPYARADFFMAFGEQGVGVEEGFITFTSLPGGFLTRAGKMRAAFGKVNGLHNHVLPWTDRPLVIGNLLGGEDGINDAGISVARLIPNRWLFLEATGQVFRGDSGDSLFRTSARGDLSYVGHLRAYQDITEDSNVDLGASWSHGHNPSGIVEGVDVGRFTTGLFGVDATYRWRPLQRSIYRSFVGRSEWVWSRRHQPNGLQSGSGGYVSGDYQFARLWFAGARYDRSNRADDESLLDTGGSLMLTYRPSEFSQVRGQYRRTNDAAGAAANEFLFQLQFAIGAHRAHPF